MKVICISGSVGAGKTSLAKKLAKEWDYNHIDLGRSIKKNKLYEGYDRKDRSYIVDIRRLTHLVNKIINEQKEAKSKGLIIDSHMSHLMPKNLVDMCIIAKCEIKTLSKRLKRRKYPKRKIQENIECEIFNVCLQEAKDLKHKTLIIDTTKPLNICQAAHLIR